jgi:endonuclease/exonuclease/phosphatase (EEP) superfamily protein YafD
VRPDSLSVSYVDLPEALERTWQTICDKYDVVADLPDTRSLLEGADLTTPDQAAETILANMLLEVMDSIPRFSPWYTRPLGLRLVRHEETQRTSWALSPNAFRQWQTMLKPLSLAIRSNVAMVLAADVLEGLEAETLPADQVLAVCLCVPPRLLRVKRAALMRADIVCDTCRQPFRPVGTSYG